MIEELKVKLGEEAQRLQHELSVTLPQEIRRAVELGDLRENSEYKAALERQQFVQARLGQLRQRLSKLSQIDVTQIPSDKVGLGSQVVVQDEKTGERESFSLVFGDSVEFEEGHVSMSSPIGKTLVGRSVGETVVLKLPAVTRRLKIILSPRWLSHRHRSPHDSSHPPPPACRGACCVPRTCVASPQNQLRQEAFHYEGCFCITRSRFAQWMRR
jgi:transcription elongation factor GreA